jgi:hypothetical protein
MGRICSTVLPAGSSRVPARRWGQPSDFEAMAAYLASPGSAGDTNRRRLQLVLTAASSVESAPVIRISLSCPTDWFGCALDRALQLGAT